MTIGRFLAKFAPFSYMWLLRRAIGDAKTVLDLGCGDGELMQTIFSDWQVTGVDIHKESLKKAKLRGIYQKVIEGDIGKIARKLIKDGKKFDVVFFSQGIEHLSKQKGKMVLFLIEKLAKNRIVVGTPRGFMKQPEIFIKNNPYQHHESGWIEEDFKKGGYKVYGVGFLPIWSESGLGRSQNKIIITLSTIISFLSAPLVYFFPTLGSGMLCIKDKEIKNEKN